MDYNIDTSSYLGLIAKESPDEMIEKVINNKRVPINKFRQIAMIAGANPETFFEIKNGKAEPIMDKGRIFYNLQGQSTFKDTFTNLWPEWVRGLVGSSEKHMGGSESNLINRLKNCNIFINVYKTLLSKANNNNKKKKLFRNQLKKWEDTKWELTQLLNRNGVVRYNPKIAKQRQAEADARRKQRQAEADARRNMTIGVASAFVILCLILKHRRNKSNRVVKLLETPSSFIKDSIEESGLSNNGYYNGALADTNSNLHHLFKVSDKKNETVDELRYRLFTKWKSSYWASNQLQSSHLIRSNGSIRNTVEEIGNAIQRLQDFNPLRIPSMSFSKVYTYLTYLSRRKSSQKYLRSRSSRKSRNRKSKR